MLHASQGVGEERARAITSLELLALLTLFSGCTGIDESVVVFGSETSHPPTHQKSNIV